MKAIIALFIFSSLSYAQTPCATPGAPDAPVDVLAIQRALVDKDNNKCPEASSYDPFGGVTSLVDLETKFNERMTAMGIQVEWGAGSDSHSSWQAFNNDDLARAKRLAKVMVNAVAAYPPGFFDKAKMKKIRMVKDLQVTGDGGAVSKRAAMPSPETNTLVMSENNDMRKDCDIKLESTFHHELFHLIEGTVHGQNGMRLAKDDWQALNASPFNYAAGGSYAYTTGGFKNLEHPREGFVTEYSYFGQEEDRAEIYSLMMTQGYASRLEGWTSVDPVLAAKKRYIENFIRNDLGAGDMTHERFERIANPPQSSSSVSVAAGAP